MSFSACRRHTPYDVAHVVGHKQRACMIKCHANGTALRLTLVINETTQDILWRTCRTTLCKRHKDDLVTAARLAIPGAMLSHECAARIVLRQQAAVVEGQSERRGMRAKGIVGYDCSSNQIRALRLDALINM